MTANNSAPFLVCSRPGKVKEQFLLSLMLKNTPQPALLNLESWLQTHAPSVQATTQSWFWFPSRISRLTRHCLAKCFNGSSVHMHSAPLSAQAADSGSSRSVGSRQKPMELQKMRIAWSKKRYLCTSGSVRSFRKVVGRSDGILCSFCETYKTNCQTQMSPYETRCGTPFDAPFFHVEHFFFEFLIQSQRKTKVVCHQFGYTDASSNTHRIRFDLWRRVDQRLDHRGLARHREQRRVRSSREKGSGPKK